MLRLIAIVMLLANSSLVLAQSEAVLLQDAINILQRMEAENKRLHERLRVLEQRQSGGLSLRVSGTFEIDDPPERSMPLGRHAFCALSVAGEDCVCIVEHTFNGEYVLRKDDHNFDKCRCAATCYQ